jgi:3',5'-cyclic AMP phosphodiesterase CpdA
VKLYAISDLHLASGPSRQALAALPAHPDDWLIVAGDVGETVEHLEIAWRALGPKFARLFWVPGNHELWTLSSEPEGLRGEAKYRRLVEVCRDHGVTTPEDPYAVWPGGPAGDGPAPRIAPLFVLYDYSFRPPEIAAAQAVEWAAETRVVCADELLLHPDPWPSREAWCADRLRLTEERLAAAAAEAPLVLVNHFPLRYDLVTLPRIPRFSIWCGTRATEDWHTRFRAVCAVHGHLHVRATHFRDGVRFEEVSLGYPRDWSVRHGVAPYLRQILPSPRPPAC